MRTILVPVADRPECAVALATAFYLARHLAANVNGYHIRPHADELHPGANVIPYRLHSYAEWQRFLSDDEIELNSAAAAEFFMRLVKEHDFKFVESMRFQEQGCLALWHELKGSPERLFSIIGPMSDLAVVSRPHMNSSIRARAFMLSALLNTSRPVLILPHSNPPEIGKRILIAWNQSAESAAAVIGALPLLQKAESVHVVSAKESFGAGPTVKHLAQYLKAYNVKIEPITTRGSAPEDEIVNTFVELRSDLLVMGAYSRGHVREMIFGGVTNHILNKTTLPTLMVHR